MTEHNKSNRKKFLYLDKFTDHQTEDLKWKKLVEEQIKRMDTEIMILSISIAGIIAGNIAMWLIYR